MRQGDWDMRESVIHELLEEKQSDFLVLNIDILDLVSIEKIYM